MSDLNIYTEQVASRARYSPGLPNFTGGLGAQPGNQNVTNGGSQNIVTSTDLGNKSTLQDIHGQNLTPTINGIISNDKGEPAPIIPFGRKITLIGRAAIDTANVTTDGAGNTPAPMGNSEFGGSDILR